MTEHHNLVEYKCVKEALHSGSGSRISNRQPWLQ